MWLSGIGLGLLVASIIAIHCARAYCAKRILTDAQYDEFRSKGMMGNFANDPVSVFWEYRFIRKTLYDHGTKEARRTLAIWRGSFAVLITGGACFAVGAVLHFLGKGQ